MLESDDVAVRLVIGGGEMTIHGQFETMLSAIVDDISHDEPPMATGSNQRPAHHVRSSWLRCIYNSSCDLLVRSRCDLSVRSLGAISWRDLLVRSPLRISVRSGPCAALRRVGGWR